MYHIILSLCPADVIVRRRKDAVDSRSAPSTRRKTFFIVNESDDEIIDDDAIARTRTASKSFVPIQESADGEDGDESAPRSSTSSSKKPSLTVSEGFDDGDDGDAFHENEPSPSPAPAAPPPPPPPPPLTLCIPARGPTTMNVEDLVMISPPSHHRLTRGGGRGGAGLSGGLFSDVIPSPLSSVTSSRDTSPTRSGPLSSSECRALDNYTDYRGIPQ